MAAQREWFEKDYYRVLGVSDTASQKDIKSAYRKLSRQYHPDANPGDRAAEERFKEVSAAYDVVGDPAKRKEYDEVRKLGPMGGMFGGAGAGAGAGGPGGAFRFDDIGDLGDVLGGLFNRARRRGGAAAGPGRGTGPHRGQDLEAELHLDFDDAVRGLTTTIHLTSDAACSTCHGSGARPGTTPHTCPQCNGRGVIDDNQGFFSFSQPCPNCAGQGFVIDDPCPTCRGTGVERRPRDVKVRLPEGVRDGQRIRLKGRGGPGRNGGPPGDLYVTTRVRSHPLFGRRGDDLTITVPVTFPEAALGADVRVPTLDGGSVKVRIPAGTRSGRTLRVRGKGVPARKAPGDLLVTVEVAVPEKLTDDERKAVEALAAAANGRSPRAHLGVEEG
jgi:molecular chaperone DnaJ